MYDTFNLYKVMPRTVNLMQCSWAKLKPFPFHSTITFWNSLFHPTFYSKTFTLFTHALTCHISNHYRELSVPPGSHEQRTDKELVEWLQLQGADHENNWKGKLRTKPFLGCYYKAAWLFDVCDLCFRFLKRVTCDILNDITKEDLRYLRPTVRIASKHFV